MFGTVAAFWAASLRAEAAVQLATRPLRKRHTLCRRSTTEGVREVPSGASLPDAPTDAIASGSR